MSEVGKWFSATLAALAFAGFAAVAVADQAEPGQPNEAAAVAAEAASPEWGSLRQIAVVPGEPGRTRVVLEGAAAFDRETLSLDDPPRVVVDLAGVVSRVERPHLAVEEGAVVRVRAAQFRQDPVPVSRVVFDLSEAVPWELSEVDGDLIVAFGAAEKAEPERVSEASEPEAPGTRAVPADALESLLRAPAFASEQPASPAAAPGPFDTRTIGADAVSYSGQPISLNLVDTDIKQIFRLFHEISGLNFVLDPGVEGNVTIVLDQVPWDQALDIILKNNGLDKQFENNVVRVATTQKLAAEAAARKQLKEAKELEVEPITITRTLSYAKAKEVEKVIREGGVLSPRGKVIVDERTNALIVSDIPNKVEPLDQLITTLDAETPQVMIEARIVETSKSFSRELGVNWGLSAIADASRGTALPYSFPRNASGRYSLNLVPPDATGVLNLKFGNILDSFTLDLALSALENEGYGRILSSPKIATQNNERAEIEQGVRIPVVNTTATEINVEFVSASLRLTVTPQITAEGTIVLDLAVENNQPDFNNRVGDVPPINTQRAETKVLITDGGTAVIGGIFTVNEGAGEVGVPWFRKIPGLGWLFKSQNISNENRELLIFITPKIIKVS